jgi:hypothetical protein
MNPKNKAKELVDKFSVVGLQQRNEGIQCALIAVDEMLNFQENLIITEGSMAYHYWNEVKTEIEKL